MDDCPSRDPIRPRSRSWIEYGAALWSSIFAVLQVVWAAGWYIGLEAEQALTLAFVRPWGRRLPRRLLDLTGWCATGLLVVRSGGSVIQGVYFAVSGKASVLLHSMALWELWFYLGAALYGLSFWRFRRRSRPVG